MKYILGKKEGMTQIFDDNGQVWPVTVIQAGPITVTQLKTNQTDGYDAIQFSFAKQKETRVGKALQGHFKKANQGAFAVVRELRLSAAPERALGDVLSVSDVFQAGDQVTVSAVSKGKGFQGVVKRHGFHGGPRSHGQKHSEREPGSIGGGARAGGRVAKGMRMGGRMGGERVTVKNLKVVAIDAEHNQLLVSGAVPGRKGTIVEIKGQDKV